MRLKKYDIEGTEVYAMIVTKRELYTIAAGLGLTNAKDTREWLRDREVFFEEDDDDTGFVMYDELDSVLWPRSSS